MTALEMYSPMMWLDEDGLLGAWVCKTVHIVKGMSRKGVWVRKSAIAIVAAAATSMVVLSAPVTDVITVDIAPRGVPVRDLHPDQHVVPDGYWDQVGVAFDTLPVAAGRDLSQDPAVMV